MNADVYKSMIARFFTILPGPACDVEAKISEDVDTLSLLL
jgi:hypothetical protein